MKRGTSIIQYMYINITSWISDLWQRCCCAQGNTTWKNQARNRSRKIYIFYSLSLSTIVCGKAEIMAPLRAVRRAHTHSALLNIMNSFQIKLWARDQICGWRKCISSILNCIRMKIDKIRLILFLYCIVHFNFDLVEPFSFSFTFFDQSWGKISLQYVLFARRKYPYVELQGCKKICCQSFSVGVPI